MFSCTNFLFSLKVLLLDAFQKLDRMCFLKLGMGLLPFVVAFSFFLLVPML